MASSTTVSASGIWISAGKNGFRMKSGHLVEGDKVQLRAPGTAAALQELRRRGSCTRCIARIRDSRADPASWCRDKPDDVLVLVKDAR
jgi:hypothetical protein